MKRINHCLNPRLAEICKEALMLETLNKKIVEFLPENLKDQCNVGSFVKGCLTLVTKDQVWASQLRYELPNLRDLLRSNGLHQLVSIKTIIKSDEESKIVKKSRLKPISELAKTVISKEADLCSYEPLKIALKKLADI